METLNKVFSGVYIVLVFLLFSQKISFSHNLGDLYYIFGIVLIITLNIAVLYLTRKSEKNMKLSWNVLVLSIYLIVSVILTDKLFNHLGTE